MEYLLIIILQILGVGFHVAQKASEIEKRSLTDTFPQVLSAFLTENRVSLFISALVLITSVVTYYVLIHYTSLPQTIPYFFLYCFGGAVVLGYAGQRIIYSFLGHGVDAVLGRINKNVK